MASKRREPTPDQKQQIKKLIAIEANPEVMAATHAQVAQLRAAKQLSLARRTLTLLLEEKERQSVSLAQLEERSGITRGNLSKLWNDPDPNATLATIERIADAMGVKVCVTLSK